MALTLLLPLLLFSFVASITPGPNNIMMMSSGLHFGIKKSLPHYVGICLGFPTMVLLSGMGVGILFTTYPFLQQWIKIIGAIYMLYLAGQIAMSHVKMQQQTRSKPLTFWQAVLFQWVNPKAWVMGMGAVTAYTVPSLNIFYQIFLISLIFLLMAIPSIGVWLFFGAILKRFLKSDTHRKYFNYTMSILLVISIALIFIE